MGMYRYESLGRDSGGMRRHEGQVEVSMGEVVPGFRFLLENGVGDGVGSSSLFYATRPTRFAPGH